MEIQKASEPYPKCPKCEIELNPWAMTSPVCKHCPRCAYDLTTITVSEELVADGDLKTKSGEKELYYLQLMLRNWTSAFTKNINEEGVDWSVPHEFLQEVAEHMLPYVDRLRKTGYLSTEQIRQLSDEFYALTGDLIQVLEQEEMLMRLTGTWTDNEQEIKDHWEEQFSKANGLTFQQFLQLPLRNEQRQLGD